MNGKQLEYFKERLFETKLLLASLMVRTHAHTGNDLEPHDGLTLDSRTKQLFLGRTTIELGTMDLIDEAIERIENGRYGLCSDCDEPINHERLDAMPWALHCFACRVFHAKGMPWN
jgi:DnaK suppressor protein